MSTEKFFVKHPGEPVKELSVFKLAAENERLQAELEELKQALNAQHALHAGGKRFVSARYASKVKLLEDEVERLREFLEQIGSLGDMHTTSESGRLAKKIAQAALEGEV